MILGLGNRLCLSSLLFPCELYFSITWAWILQTAGPLHAENALTAGVKWVNRGTYAAALRRVILLASHHKTSCWAVAAAACHSSKPHTSISGWKQLPSVTFWGDQLPGYATAAWKVGCKLFSVIQHCLLEALPPSC